VAAAGAGEAGEDGGGTPAARGADEPGLLSHLIHPAGLAA
jgi:hypothetical protein